ncbi:hypothetical protein [Phytopseudomonas punonensis]|uniref:Lipoprotein n=1 Tax=Phytopseudomonas punonensis TaxID=1220495 RepID=A0A1M7AZ32_9GAMM|nr:hypothetical protein [Pseudomonas punonensis]SHL48010.1 hypothetical protein SAMN05216288_2027 [Pseudomonas punonensis]
MLSPQTRRMRALILILLFSTLTACWGRQPFQPPPFNFEIWQKPGASTLEVKKALLECGSPHPQEDDRPPNQRAETQSCLIAAGYRMPKQYPSWCTLQPDLPACQSGVVPPSPSAERRLQSDYCRAKRDMEFCRRTASNPSACTLGPVDPECLP